MATITQRIIPWFKLGAEYAIAHFLTRALAAVGAIALVRILSVEEYAVYTLFLSAITFIFTFSDLGATQTLSYFRWRVAKKNQPWLPYLNVVLKFRRITFFFGFAFAALYVWNVGSELYITDNSKVVGIALIGIGGWLAMQAGILTYALKLEQQFYYVYTIEVVNEVIKLLVIATLFFTGIKTALGGMTSVVLGALVAALIATALLRLSNKGKPLLLSPRQMTQGNKVLLGQILPVLPGTIHFALQGIFVAWLAAYYGSAENLAEVGALGRIGALIAVLAGFTNSVFVPKLVSISDDNKFFKMYLMWWIVILSFGVVVGLFVTSYPSLFLALLGSSYQQLELELLVIAGTSIFSIYALFAWGVNRARGWIKYQPFRVPFVLLGQVIMFVWFDFSTTLDVLLFSLGTMTLDALFQTILNFQGHFSQNATINSTANRRRGL